MKRQRGFFYKAAVDRVSHPETGLSIGVVSIPERNAGSAHEFGHSDLECQRVRPAKSDPMKIFLQVSIS